MWTFLFLGQGIQVSLYCQEWYARRHCPLPQVRQQALPVPLARQGIQQPALLGSDLFNSYGQGQGVAGEGDSCFRFIMCVTKSDLTHNLPFPHTDNILGAGDTPLLVLPSLEILASSLCADDSIKLFSEKHRAGAPHYLIWMKSGTCTKALPGAHGDSDTHVCGPQAQDGVT